MSLATHSPLSPSLPDAMMQVSGESEQSLSVSCLNPLAWLLLTIAWLIQDSGLASSALFANIQNLLITGGTFVVSLSCGLHKQLMIVNILSARTMFYLPILEKGPRRSLYFQDQTLVHCLLGGKIYLTSFGRFLFIVLIVNWSRGAPVSYGEQGGLERLRSVSNL